MVPSAGFFSSPDIRPFLSKRTRQSEAFAVILAQCGPRDGSSVFEPRALFSGAIMSKKKKTGLGSGELVIKGVVLGPKKPET